MTLNGKWKLYFSPQDSIKIISPLDLATSGMNSIPCTVPGNVELDLAENGFLPKDLFMGENIRQAEKYEIYEWWYETEFDAPAPPDSEHRMVLDFKAVDCFAEYYLNGEKIGESSNMFISKELDVTDFLKYNQKNILHVNIKSASIKGSEYDIEPNNASFVWNQTLSSINVRKAPHSYGWDIFPRALSAGIWRDVELNSKKIYDFKYTYFVLTEIKGNNGMARLIYDSKIKPEYLYKDLQFKITGVCNDNKFEHISFRKNNSGHIDFEIDNICLWWPRNYGKQDMYDINIEVTAPDGKIILEKQLVQGFRTIELRNSDIVKDGGSFDFIVNGEKIMIAGTNWVPMDVYHSRDKERYQKAFELADEIGVNMIRCWGGNVYEQQDFFDFCNEKGILVWQDFSMACHNYPQNESFFKTLSEEVIWVVSQYRHNPSLAVWAGDNEIDLMLAHRGINPDNNKITRQIIPDILYRFDPHRPYIPSSPYISEEAFKLGSKFYPEDHLWGPRDYFKSNFYTTSNAYFVSETGYHGCPSRKSIEKFIEAEYIWPYTDNPQWNLHSSDQDNRDHRTMLMHKQVLELFGEVPDNLDDYAIASQISQAEAKKFFIERVRAKMSTMGGIIWWNLLDGWPQMSDAVVDYYYEKKLAFDYIKRSSRDFIIMIDEMGDWGHRVLCANSSLKTFKGNVKITDIDSGEIFFKTDFVANPNSNTTLGKIPLMYSAKGMFLIEWTLDNGEKYFNTYLYGSPAFSFKQYKKWLEKMKG